jgi:hypothetical protein
VPVLRDGRRAAAFLRRGLVVGTILNLINQGDALFEGGHVNITKIILTYAVPYCVATYGAVSYRLSTNKRLNSR